MAVIVSKTQLSTRSATLNKEELSCGVSMDTSIRAWVNKKNVCNDSGETDQKERGNIKTGTESTIM